MASTNCPACDASIRIDSPKIGDKISCKSCGEELEIIDTRPFEVDFPMDDDWDDDDDDDDDDEDEDDKW